MLKIERETFSQFQAGVQALNIDASVMRARDQPKTATGCQLETSVPGTLPLMSLFSTPSIVF